MTTNCLTMNRLSEDIYIRHDELAREAIDGIIQILDKLGTDKLDLEYYDGDFGIERPILHISFDGKTAEETLAQEVSIVHGELNFTFLVKVPCRNGYTVEFVEMNTDNIPFNDILRTLENAEDIYELIEPGDDI